MLAHLPDLPRLPAYVYDLAGLREHAAGVRAALSGAAELFYAAKANPDAPILRALEPFVDGFEVASGGELEHVRAAVPGAPLAFGGPGKTDEELALAGGVQRLHVESPHELRRLIALGERPVDVLLRANLDLPVRGAALAMSGPFGMDEDGLAECAALLPHAPWLRLRGVHAHLASGLDAPAMLDLAARIAGWALPWLAGLGVDRPELNLGGGMAVDYRNPAHRFDWAAYGSGLAAAGHRARLRIEPGRAITAYHGWYVTEVLDVKRTRGEAYAVLRGGTHHLRTPVTKGHDQPFTVLGTGTGPALGPGPVTLVGQLCTPKDVFATRVEAPGLRVGDRVAFGMAGAYAWNISHHGFLMHPRPDFHYVSG
ncbi:type III PLP-dependent enzyme [Actinomadura craniellae]|uniref:type III PLP-dependent enzyme n=1 Tax=Actinomadura craniellae TaxID=2231787 RepID=UPI001F2FED39|nr:type III PLP-dependent enzyme [Actinomadura craniellae]